MVLAAAVEQVLWVEVRHLLLAVMVVQERQVA
jgi:hypothetical protein